MFKQMTWIQKILKRFDILINGPHSAVFVYKMDILTSGYGKLDVDTTVLLVKFVVEEKNKFQLILFIILFLLCCVL